MRRWCSSSHSLRFTERKLVGGSVRQKCLVRASTLDHCRKDLSASLCCPEFLGNQWYSSGSSVFINAIRCYQDISRLTGASLSIVFPMSWNVYVVIRWSVSLNQILVRKHVIFRERILCSSNEMRPDEAPRQEGLTVAIR